MAMKHLAEHADRGACSAKDVADSYRIPQELLAKILQRLVKSGLLKSQHGTHGGYVLARDAKSISAYEVIRAIDGGARTRAPMPYRSRTDDRPPVPKARRPRAQNRRPVC